MKFLAYMRLKKLKKVLIGDDEPEEGKNEEAYAELIQFLDDRSLGLVMHAAADNGRNAFKILRQHYAGTGKPRIISLYTQLTSLRKENSESITDYVLRAETASTALKCAGEVVSDGLVIAMVLKGLPIDYQAFVVVVTQSEKAFTFQEFKVALRNFEENEKARSLTDKNDANKGSGANQSSVMKNKYFDKSHRSSNIKCYSCGFFGHKSVECTKKKRWCGICKSTTHAEKVCRRVKTKQLNSDSSNKDDIKKACDDERTFYTFCMKFYIEGHEHSEYIG